MGVFRAHSAPQREAHRQFWVHAIASASAALTLARKKKLSSHDQEQAFVGGLLHDLGRLFLFTNFTDDYVTVDKLYREGANLRELELESFGLTHCQVGQVLAHVWKFPERLAELMGTHEGPFTDSSENLELIIHVSHLVADLLTWDPNALDRLDPKAKIWLEDLEDQFFQIRNEVEAKVYSYEMLYGLLAA
jgi:putative nucleotidyltransferase with HDIG domain